MIQHESFLRLKLVLNYFILKALPPADLRLHIEIERALAFVYCNTQDCFHSSKRFFRALDFLQRKSKIFSVYSDIILTKKKRTTNAFTQKLRDCCYCCCCVYRAYNYYIERETYILCWYEIYDTSTTIPLPLAELYRDSSSGRKQEIKFFCHHIPRICV